MIETEQAAAQRANVATANYNDLVGLMRDHTLFIPAKDFHNWRPTKRSLGDITGVITSVEIIATNGLLAYFRIVRTDREDEIFYGHIQCFTGDVLPLHSTPKEYKEAKVKNEKRKQPKKKKEKSRRAQELENL